MIKNTLQIVSLQHFLERNCWKKRKKSGEVAGEKEKKRRTKGASNLRRKLVYLSIIHNINNTYLVSLSHTSTSPLNNIYFLALEFLHIYFLIFADIFQPNLLPPVYNFLAHFNIFLGRAHFLPRPTTGQNVNRQKKKERQKEDLNVQLPYIDEGPYRYIMVDLVLALSASCYQQIVEVKWKNVCQQGTSNMS